MCTRNSPGGKCLQVLGNTCFLLLLVFLLFWHGSGPCGVPGIEPRSAVCALPTVLSLPCLDCHSSSLAPDIFHPLGAAVQIKVPNLVLLLAFWVLFSFGAITGGVQS